MGENTQSAARLAHYPLLYASMLAMGAGASMLQALAAPIVRQFHFPAVALGGLFSLSALLGAVSNPYWGKLSDEWGRKPVILIGLVAMGVSNLVFAGCLYLGEAQLLLGAGLFTALCLARGIHGLIGSGYQAPAQAWVVERTPEAERIKRLGGFMAAAVLGSVIGPALIGVAAAHIGLVWPIIIVGGIYLSLAAAVSFLPPDAPQSQRSASQADSLLQAALAPELAPFLLYGLGLAVVQGVQSQVFGLYVLDRLHVEGAQGAELAALGFSAMAIAMLGTQVIVLPLLKVGSRKLMMYGAALMALALALQIIAPGLIAILAGQILFGVGGGIARPGFVGGASASAHDKQGAVAGLSAAVSGAGYVVAPVLGGLTYDLIGMTAPFWIALAIVGGMLGFSAVNAQLRAAGA